MNIQDINKVNQELLNRVIERQELIDSALKEGRITPETSIEDISEPKLFFNLLQDVSAQQKAPKIEKFIARKMGWEIVPSSEDRGDFVTPEGKYIESKISTNNQAQQANMKQLRMWQNVDYYLCGYIDQSDLSKSVIYFLTKEQMLEQVERYGSVMHGTSSAVKENKNVEMAIAIKVYSTRSERSKLWNSNFVDDKLKYELLGV